MAFVGADQRGDLLFVFGCWRGCSHARIRCAREVQSEADFERTHARAARRAVEQQTCWRGRRTVTRLKRAPRAYKRELGLTITIGKFCVTYTISVPWVRSDSRVTQRVNCPVAR